MKNLLLGATVFSLGFGAALVPGAAATLDDVMARLDSIQSENQAMRAENQAMRKELASLRRKEGTPAPTVFNDHSSSRALPPSVSSAMAADLPAKAPMYSPAPPVAYSWTGIYVGAHVGYGNTSKEWNLLELAGTPTGGLLLGSGNVFGGLGGVQAGVNYQIGNIVIGAQGDFSWADISGQTCNTQFVGTIICTAQLKEISTLTGRFGVAADRALFYMKGGGAWTKETQQASLFVAPGPSLAAFVDQTKTGWTAGAGVEYALMGNWTVMAEYDFISFGNTRNTLVFPTVPAPGNTLVADIRQRVQMVKLGLNYKFDWGMNPVVARY